jgi:hypothetical protein
MLREIFVSALTDGFRFTHTQIRKMLEYFELESIGYRYKCKCPPETALCLVLFRLSAPCRYKELMYLFQRSRGWLSVVFNDVVWHLVFRYQAKLEWDERRLTWDTLTRYAEAIHDVGGGQNIWGFIDGTVRPISRPDENQRRYYSGYKKTHAMKFQAVTTPDGLMSHLAGPWEGRVGDYRMFIESNLQGRLRELNALPNGADRRPEERLYIYGDPAYGLSYGIMSAFKAQPGAPLDPIQQAINTAMSSVRISVEHGFAKTMMLWSFNGFKYNLKVGLSPVGGYFMVAVLLCNIHTCFNGNQTSNAAAAAEISARNRAHPRWRCCLKF